jgi:hypothetical protein
MNSFLKELSKTRVFETECPEICVEGDFFYYYIVR